MNFQFSKGTTGLRETWRLRRMCWSALSMDDSAGLGINTGTVGTAGKLLAGPICQMDLLSQSYLLCSEVSV